MFTVTDTKRGKCHLCLPKGKEAALFHAQGESFRGWACADHLAALIEGAKAPEEPSRNGEVARQ